MTGHGGGGDGRRGDLGPGKEVGVAQAKLTSAPLWL